MYRSALRSHYVFLHYFKVGYAELGNNMAFSPTTQGQLAQF